MITTWSGYLTSLQVLLQGENARNSHVPVSTLTEMTALGEARIYREVRTRYNEKAFSSVTVTSNLATIPTDFEAPSIVHFGRKALEPVSEEFMLEYLDSNPTGDAKYFCQAGASFKFGPSVANATAVQGRYFYRMDSLDATTLPTNALFAASNDLFLYAALVESAPFFEQDARIPLWDAKYQSIRDQLNRQSRNAAYAAGRMKVRPSTSIIR